jgi:hypothetical protein
MDEPCTLLCGAGFQRGSEQRAKPRFAPFVVTLREEGLAAHALHYAASFEQYSLVYQSSQEVQSMFGDDDGPSLMFETGEHRGEVLYRFDGKVGCRFIEEEQRRVRTDGLGASDFLKFPARHLFELPFQQIPDAGFLGCALH